MSHRQVRATVSLYKILAVVLICLGYKMRTSIAKSLQVRCKTIRRAVDRYNAAALAMDPPRPTVDWTKVSHYSFLEEFVLLQDTRNDVREKPWARPEIHSIIKLYRRVQHAREEIDRLNMEVRRVHTAALDEDMLFEDRLKSMESSDPLRGALSDFVTRRRRTNIVLLQRVEQIYSLRGFSGVRGPGMRFGHGVSTSSSATSVSQAPSVPPPSRRVDHEDDEDDAGDEDVHDSVHIMMEYIGDLAVLA